jgi:hypothetical protein
MTVNLKHEIKIISFICFIIIFTYDNTNANQLRLGFSPGVGSYSLTEMKDLQISIFNNTRREISGLKQLEDFPGYYNFSVWMDIKFKNHSLGLNYTRLSTGARNSVSDYSGRYNFDMLLGSDRLLAFHKYWFYYKPEISPLHGFTYIKFGYSGSLLKMKEELKILDLDKYESNHTFSSRGKVLEFGLGGAFRIFSFLEYNMTIGYDIDFSQDLKDAQNPDNYLKDISGNNISPNWSGFRFTMGLNLMLDDH